MPTSPAHLMSVIEDADAIEPRGGRRIILEVHAARLLGEAGRYLGHEDERPVYGYTRRQCRRIVESIKRAAAEDAATAAGDDFDDGFGDGVDQ